MFDFEWPVDRDGYEWADDAGAGWLLRRRGGPNTFYRPLEDYPGVFRRFASLPEDRQALLDFTTMFGFLYGSTEDQFFMIDEIFRDRLRRFKIIINLMDASLQNAANVSDAAVFFNGSLYYDLTCKIYLDLRKNPPTQQLRPTSLYGAMIIQASQEIAGIAKFRKCRRCDNWFALGKLKATSRREFCSDLCRVSWHRQQQIGDTK